MIRYVPASLWLIILGYVLYHHVKVYRLYDRQLQLIKRIEETGTVEPGSTLVAYNQRVRYTVRITLAISGIIIGIGAIWGAYSDHVGAIFTWCVLGYFYVSEVTTGYLTLRDQHVITRILQLDGSAANETTGPAA